MTKPRNRKQATTTTTTTTSVTEYLLHEGNARLQCNDLMLPVTAFARLFCFFFHLLPSIKNVYRDVKQSINK